ncbi:putative hexose transporter 2 [Amylocarpus encephaloides]|uniref:Hexose transporter 2 n=1 Tax=Amylocarpus encephaloides TaxID=45428 RepID=A0A9P8C3B8_9HELO|nr:putative hexose transporter 2 [Amylocarpus encephaloides]
MRFFGRKDAVAVPAEKDGSPIDTPLGTTARNSSISPAEKPAIVQNADVSEPPATWEAVIMGAIASIGGFMFGYESGQISGFLQMSDFLDRFGKNGEFSAVRQGSIVALLCAGTLVGCLASGDICDRIGRRYTISASAFFYIIGVIIETTSDKEWVQFAMGRFTAGLGIGALSTSVPMYQSESVPPKIRGAIVASYQLLITLGIWTAYMVNYRTSAAYSNSAQWRIPNGLSALWAIILGTAILFMPESPRFAYRKGKIEEARRTMAKLVKGGEAHGPYVDRQIREIQEKQEAEEDGGEHHWWEIFVIPSIRYRTILGMVLQAGQQLTGANFFFYYGTTIFLSTGISNSYITSIILGSVNVLATIAGLWIVKNCGRRLFWPFCSFATDPLSTKGAGGVLIAFTCIFITAFATTWGPLVWAITGEIYPARYRSACLAIATASNWLFNFLISFFTTFITDKIDYFYGLVFAGCTFALFFIVYFFVPESKDRSMEEIDTMFVLGIPPRKSAAWKIEDVGPEGMSGIATDKTHFAANGRDIKKQEGNGNLMVHDEKLYPENAGPSTV